MNKKAIQVISTFQQSSIWACHYYYSCKVVVIFFLGWYAYRDQETAFKQLCQVSDHTVNNALNCPCLRCKDCVLWDWHSLHLSASCKATLKAPTPALKFVRHYFGHSVIIYNWRACSQATPSPTDNTAVFHQSRLLQDSPISNNYTERFALILFFESSQR